MESSSNKATDGPPYLRSQTGPSRAFSGNLPDSYEPLSQVEPLSGLS